MNHQFSYERFNSAAGRSREYFRRRILELHEREVRFDEDIARLAALLRGLLSLAAPAGRSVGETAAELASATLSIECPRIVEIAPGEDLDKNGYAIVTSRNDNRIGVRFQGRCACEIAGTAAHEVRHRHQAITGNLLDLIGQGKSETDAERFAEDFFKRFDLAGRCHCRRLQY